MRTYGLILFATTLLASSAAFSDPATPPTATPAPAATPAAPAQMTAAVTAPASDPIVCHTQPITGSRLGVQRVCMKQSEWDERMHRDQRSLQRMEEREHSPGH